MSSVQNIDFDFSNYDRTLEYTLGGDRSIIPSKIRCTRLTFALLHGATPDQVRKHVKENPVDLELRNNHDQTPLFIAAIRSQTLGDVMVETLLNLGADPNAIISWGQATVLAIVCLETGGSSTLGTARLLLEHKADPNGKGKGGVMPLSYAT